jgi:hypothetical protein
MVSHSNGDIKPRLERWDVTRTKDAILRLHPDNPTIRHGLGGIQDHVVNDLMELANVGVHRPKLTRHRQIGAGV